MNSEKEALLNNLGPGGTEDVLCQVTASNESWSSGCEQTKCAQLKVFEPNDKVKFESLDRNDWSHETLQLHKMMTTSKNKKIKSFKTNLIKTCSCNVRPNENRTGGDRKNMKQYARHQTAYTKKYSKK